MKTAHRTMITTLAAAGFALLAGAAYAFPPGAGPCGTGGGPGMGAWGGGPGAMARGYGPGMRGGYGPGPRAGAGFQPGAGPAVNAEARLAFLKDQLKITAEQQAAWDAYAAKAKERAGTMVALRAQMVTAAQVQSGPDRAAQRAEVMKQRAASMETMSAALKDLYDVLTPEQKAIADQAVGGGMRYAQAGPRGGFGPGNGPGGGRGYGPRW